MTLSLASGSKGSYVKNALQPKKWDKKDRRNFDMFFELYESYRNVLSYSKNLPQSSKL